MKFLHRGFYETREDRTKRLFRHYTVGSYDNFTSYSDYIIEEKNAVLQKKENEGFGFVLRGAKAETPIEEFTPTPAFPALQYLESVDVEGVAWRAGLRTGDFLIEVNGVNVVKVGHKQVVSLIRQGGNHLLMKVVSVSRKPESEEVVRKKARWPDDQNREGQSRGARALLSQPPEPRSRAMKKFASNRSLNKVLQQCESSSSPEYDEIKAVKKRWNLHLGSARRILSRRSKVSSSPLFFTAPAPPKRAPSTTLTLRSKSMTAELEELASARRRRGERLDEMLISQEPVLRPQVTEADYRAATVKQRPTSRRITPAEISSLFERQGMAAHGGLHLGLEKAHIPLPKGMSRTKSFGAPEDDRLSALDTPPAFCPPPPPGRGHDQSRSSFKPGLDAKVHGLAHVVTTAQIYDPPRSLAHAERQKKARSMIILQDSSHLPVEPTDLPRLGSSPTPTEKIKRKGRVIDNPYANVGQFSIGLYTPTKPQRKKSPLVKQLQVEDAQERAFLASAHSRDHSPTGRIPHTSRAEYYQQQLLQERAARAQGEGPFAAAIAGAVKDRERRLQERRKSTVFLSVGTMEGSSIGSDLPLPSLTQSRSIDERLLSRELGQLPPPAPALTLRPSPGGTTFIHPLTGKPLDPSSPLALALAARERALTSQSQSPTGSPESRTKHESPGPLFVDTQTKEAERLEAEGGLMSLPYSPEAPGGYGPPLGAGGAAGGPSKSPWGSPSTLRREMEARMDKEERKQQQEDKKQSLVISIPAELGLEELSGSPAETPGETPKPMLGEIAKRGQSPGPEGAGVGQPPPASPEKTLAQGSSEEDVEPYTVTLPPALLSSSDEETREELRKIGVVPPPNEFANGLLAKLGKPVDGSGPQLARLAAPSASTQAAAAAAAAAAHTPSPSGKPSDTHLVPESAADSGVEEIDVRSSSDHHLETTSTVSTVSSMSTLSSEGGEPMDTYSSYADGQTFILDKPPVPPKPKLKSQLGKGPVTFRDPLLKQSSDSELLSQQNAAALAAIAAAGRPRYLFQRRSKLWGDPMETRPPPGPEDGKPTVIGELSSRLQQLNKDSRSLGEEPMGASLDPGRKSPGRKCHTRRL
ncbi:hypothetical protein AAFF_G00265740 [Aldrovandia affinis]|uniref:PDZ domain-containing protein n=1 Tax=Aldrovandia affinis TaxID=143900 RepID=A0AAD7RBH3_9TELE|nr:hypothetical protein AAFF_G00265740 [Aldrovandia affinis]